MSVELLRQLDAYGDHVAGSIEHVDADEIRERVLLRRGEQARPRRRWIRPAVLASSAVAVLVIAVAGNAFLTGSRIDSNFSEIGLALGGDEERSTSAPATTAAAGAGFRAEALDDSVRLRAVGGQDPAPSETQAPATTSAPSSVESDPVAQAGRDIVFVADMRVSVTDSGDAGERATLIVESVGGFLAGEQTTGGANATTVLTFKVPPQSFRGAVDRLGEIGVVTDRVVTADDVTDRVVDLESQISTAEISVERLRTFLEEAASVNDVAKLEKELTNRERDLEQLRGQLKTIQDRVALATIRVTFSEAIETPKLQLTTSAYVAKADDGTSCPGSRSLEIKAGEDATVCIQITNNGKTQLTDVEVTAVGSELLTGNLITVDGDLSAVMEPGDVIVLATDVTVIGRIRADVTVTATPINEAGDAVPDRFITQTKRVSIDIADPGGLPGFGDAWERGTSALATAGGLALIVLGAILPWLWLPVLVALVVWWRRRR